MRTTIAFAFVAISTSAILVSAAPMAMPDGGSAYTGAGGSAVGGTLTENNSAMKGGLAGGDDILGIASGNAGDGGKASSGTAVGGQGSAVVSYVNGQPVITSSNGGSAYSGVGGNTNGGNINNNNNAGPYYNNNGNGYRYGYYGYDSAAQNLDALNIASGNAGDGGDASSGAAIGGSSVPVNYVPGYRYY